MASASRDKEVPAAWPPYLPGSRIRGVTIVMRAIAILAVACSHRVGPPAAGLAITQQVEKLGLLAKEPMIAVHPDGTLFVAGFGEPSPTLWSSGDRGATWQVPSGP